MMGRSGILSSKKSGAAEAGTSNNALTGYLLLPRSAALNKPTLSSDNLSALQAIHTLVHGRFWSRIDKSGECWLWRGSVNNWGYGSIHVCDTRIYVHRLSWMLANGDIPDGMYVCHSCDNPACVRPDHLWLGTPQQNQRDMRDKGRARGPAVGRLTDSQVISIREEYATGNISTTKLAQKYGIGQSTVMHILKRRTWAHLPESKGGA